MQTVHYVKSSTILLLSILPVSLLGYFFSVDYENIFFLYEVALIIIILGAGVLALTGVIRGAGTLRWILLSIFAFAVQFSSFGLFLGPFTIYPMFYVFYVITFFTILTYFKALYASDRYRVIPGILMMVSILITVYILILNNLWGKDLT